MKNIFRWLLCPLLLIAAQLYALPSNSQTAAVAIGKNRLTLNELMEEIEAQTEYLFVYNKKDVDPAVAVRLSGDEKNVGDVLDAALAPTDVAYRIENNYISLSARTLRAPEAQSPQPTGTRSGVVLNEGGEPLVGVMVTVAETGAGSITDVEGYFQVAAGEGQTMRFAYLGYETVERPVPASDQRFRVVMIEQVERMDEVVVVGMGSQRRASVVGSVSNIQMSQLKIPNRSLSNSFAGRLAGVVAVQRSGEPGYDNSNFWIRGISTFGSNRTPLILVDGVERSDAMNNLDPEEIESVSILKDASATAVYGVRAANGVVLVTTRKGVARDKASVELKMEYGVSQLTRMPKLLDGVSYMQLYNEAAGTDIFSAEKIEATRLGTDPYLNPNVNWFDEIFKKNSNNKNVSINVNGGGQTARYFVSFGYMDENGNFRDNPANDYRSNISYQRYNFRTNVDVSLTSSTRLDVEVGGHLVDSHYPGTGTASLFDLAYMANPVNVPVNFPTGELDTAGNMRYVWAGNNSASNRNPAERLLGSGFSTEFRNQFMGQMRLTQDFDKWVEGLSANVAFAFDAYNQTNIQRHKSESYYLANGRDEEGNLQLIQQTQGNEFLGYGRSLSSNRAIELKAQLNYDRVLADVHRFGAMAMFYRRDYRDGNAETAINSLPYRKQGIAFRATYSYDDRYFAEFNMGYNGSENFAPSKRYGFFPAGAVGYMLSNEKFWKEGRISNVISMLKLRGSVGLVGAEDLVNGARYGYLTVVGDGLGGYNFGINNSGFAGTGEDQLGAEALTWETGLKSNIGVQIDFFRGMVSLEVDAFHENRRNILVQRSTLPGVVGIETAPYANMGRMENKGIEGTLEMNRNIGKLQYRLYANATYNKNKILERDEAKMAFDYLNSTGKPLGQQMGLISLGYFRDADDVAGSPAQKFGTYGPGDVKYMDVNGDGSVDTYDRVPIGFSDVPELTYGFGVQLMYGGFDLGLFFRGQSRVSYMLGGEGFIPFKEGGSRGNLFVEALDRWTPENPDQNAFYPRLHITPSNNNYEASTKWLYNGRFLRLADVEFGYSLPKRWLEPINIQGLRVYFHGSNMALFSPFKMWDPEIGKGRGDAYPLQRKFNFGLRLTF